jgi:hypothetical protein
MHSVFPIKSGVTLLLYVDDIILTTSSEALLRSIVSSLTTKFSMKDLGHLHHFLGMVVSRSTTGMFLSQRHYILELLDRAGMSVCKPCTTPIDTNAKLSADGPPAADATDYRALAGALQWLTFTRQISLMPCSRFVYICTILVSPILP